MLLQLTAAKLLPAPLAVSIRVGYTSLVLLVFLTLQAFAGSAEQAQLLEALKLGNQGKFAQEVQLLDSLVHSVPAALDDANRGMAWNTLGTLHMLMGDNEQSRRVSGTGFRDRFQGVSGTDELGFRDRRTGFQGQTGFQGRVSGTDELTPILWFQGFRGFRDRRTNPHPFALQYRMNPARRRPPKEARLLI